MNWLLGLALAAAICLAALCAAVYFFLLVARRGKAFRVKAANIATGSDWDSFIAHVRESKAWLLAQPIEEVCVRARDGICLRGVLLAAQEPTGRTILAFHGFKSMGVNDFATIAPFYHALGLNLLIVDNRAHGKSEGKYIGFGCLDRFDCLRWVDYAAERYGDGCELVLHGISMGGATVLMACDGLPGCVKGVISDCGFTSAWEVFTHILKRDYHLPPFPVLTLSDWLCKHLAGFSLRECDTTRAVREWLLPILFIHGEGDSFVPTSMSVAAYRACPSVHKELLLVNGAAHAASYHKAPGAYELSVQKLLADCGMLTGSPLSREVEQKNG